MNGLIAKMAMLSGLALVLSACGATPPPAPPALVPAPMAYVASSSPNLQAMKTAQAGALSVPALVMFYSDDCHSCRVDRPLVSQLDQQFDGRVKFIYLDVGLPESQPYLAQFDVRGLPTIALLDRGGKVVINFAGWPGDAAIRTEIEQLLAQP